MKKDQKIDLIELLMDQISEGILFVDTDEKIVIANQAATKLLGRSKADLIGSRLHQIFSGEELGFSLEEALDKGELPGEVDLDVNEATCEVRSNFAVDENQEEILGLIMTMRDVTSVRRMQEQKNRKSRWEELGQMVSVITHDLKNPLGGIKGFASLLARELEEGTKQRDMAEKICQGADDLSDILQQVVDYTKTPELSLAEEDIGELAEELVALLKEDEKIQNCRLSLKKPDHPLTAEIDRAQIKSALSNLIVNGAEAIQDQGSIRVGLSEKGQEAAITVEDDGEGMDDETKSRIFRPLFSTKQDGTGVGLASVKRIVEAHSGDISVATEPGEGTKFTITIPRKHED